VLGSGRVFSLRVALAVVTLLVALTTASPAAVAAADPSPAPSGVLIDPLDPRAGAGANRVGAPLLALLAVIGLGVAAAALTALYVRLVRPR
jgi:hypothetical protein